LSESLKVLADRVKDLEAKIAKLENEIAEIKKIVSEMSQVENITIDDIKNAVYVLEQFERQYRRWISLKKRIGMLEGSGRFPTTFEGMVGAILKQTMSAQQPVSREEGEEEETEIEKLPSHVRETVYKLRKLRRR